MLEQIGTSERIEETETEPGVWGERLQLLAVVRGLEALEQPSRVTLITSSRYVCNGIRQNINQWRENDWQWEKFGEMIPIKNLDLWKRIDQAMQFHQIDCRVWEFGFESLSKTTCNRIHQPTHAVLFNPGSESLQPRPQSSNRISMEELRKSRHRDEEPVSDVNGTSIPIKPMGRGRAFGLCTC